MANNFIGPYWFEVDYVSAEGGFQHTHRGSLNGTGTWAAGLTNTVIHRDSSTEPVTSYMTAYLAAFANLFRDTDSIGLVSVFYAPTFDTPPVLVDTFDADYTGTQTTGADVVRSELVFTFKTPHKGNMRTYALEGPWPFNQVIRARGDLNSFQATFVDFILGDSNANVGRNGDQPLAFMSAITKDNDHMRKQRIVAP